MVKFSDIEDAFLFVSGSDGGSAAVLQKSTGRIFYRSELSDLDELEEEGLGEEDWDGDDLIEIPTKQDLDLGRQLVFRFVQNRLPHDRDRVRAMFSRRGAYARVKEFLDERGLLQSWYDFENEAEGRALRKWCDEHGIEVSS